MSKNMSAVLKQLDSHKVASLSMMSMVAEKYLTLESADSPKMALEISASWDCIMAPY